MARVISTLPNQSARTNGVAFENSKGQFLSEEVGDDVAADFALIPGYRIAGKKPAPATADNAGTPPNGDE